MKPKKNPQSDFSKRSLLFFQIGLILVLFISWQAIEWKTYKENPPASEDLVYFDDFSDPEVPVTLPQTETPPLKPIPKNVIDNFEPVDNTEENKEEKDNKIDFIEPVTYKGESLDVNEVTFVAKKEVIEVPFDNIQEVPIFPGCETLSSNKERKDCMNEKIRTFVNRKFDKNISERLGLKGINKIYLTFQINEKGEVVGVRSRAPHPKLKDEAERVINLLPKMTPGKQGNDPVKVLYSLPIIYKVQD